MSEICRYFDLKPDSVVCKKKIQASGSITVSGIRQCHPAKLAEVCSDLQLLDPLDPKRQEVIAEAQEKLECNGYRLPLRCGFARSIVG